MKKVTILDKWFPEFVVTVRDNVEATGCRHNFRHARRILESYRDADASATFAWLESQGVACDCEIARRWARNSVAEFLNKRN